MDKYSTSSASATTDAAGTSYSASEGSHSTRQAQKTSNEKLPDVGLKWGRTPKDPTASSAKSHMNDQPDWENYYSEDEKAKLRAKGINPALKAEMEYGRKRSKEASFWSKVAGTAFGGGIIK